MTESKDTSDIVSVHKITGDRVEIGLAEFIEMCNAVRAAKDTEKANEWLRKKYTQLQEELQYTRQHSRPQAPHVVVYRRDLAGNLHVQYIEGMQQGGDGTIYVTIGEPS